MIFDKIFLEKLDDRITVSFMNEPHKWTEIFSVTFDKNQDGNQVLRGIESTFIALYGSEVLSDLGE